MIRVLIKILLISTVISSSCYAADCAKAKVEDIAQEAVLRELKGASLSAKLKCLSEHDFKLVKPIWRPPMEGNKILDVGVLDKTLKVTNIKKIEDFTGQYEVSYEAEADKLYGGGIRKSKLTIVTKLEPRMKERHGCAMTLVVPEVAMLARSCYEEAIKNKGMQ